VPDVQRVWQPMDRRGVFLVLAGDRPKHRIYGGDGTFPTSVTLGFYDVGASMTVGAQVGANFTLSTSSYETITPGTQPTNVVTAVLGGSGQTLTAGNYLLCITDNSNLALPEYLGSGHGIFVDDGILDLAPGQTYKLLGNSFDIGVALSNSVPETSTWAMVAVGFAGLGFAGLRRTRRSAAAVA
jgi:hypothetical protein